MVFFLVMFELETVEFFKILNVFKMAMVNKMFEIKVRTSGTKE